MQLREQLELSFQFHATPVQTETNDKPVPRARVGSAFDHMVTATGALPRWRLNPGCISLSSQSD